MNSGKSHSLRWRLVHRLVAVQAVMLAVFILLVVAALWGGGFLMSLETEDETIDVLRAAVTRDANGNVILRDTPDLVQRRAEVPDFWFVIRDRSGHSLSEGAVPVEFAGIGAALQHIGQARLGWNIGDPPHSPARMKWVDTAAGDIQILTGPGSKVSWQRVARAMSTLFLSVVLPVVLLMALATLITTPLVVRRTLAGLGHVAAQAKKIDSDKRGTRLPLGDVPAEIIPLVSAVNDALRRLDEGYERHKRFLIDAAHELRTPIAILQTRLESLSLGSNAARVLEDVARLSTLAEQMLDLQRVNRQIDSFIDVDLVAICKKVTSDLAPLAIAAGYEMSFEAVVDHVHVSGDQGALERAVTNLIQNAIQHGGRKGHIAIRVMLPATISVSDEGPGIPLQHRENVFEPFYRLDGQSRGVGLGLNLVREIVRLHGGHIEMLENPGGGACVEILLSPLERVEPRSGA
jgi:signal transduction histidine kinase